MTSDMIQHAPACEMCDDTNPETATTLVAARAGEDQPIKWLAMCHKHKEETKPITGVDCYFILMRAGS